MHAPNWGRRAPGLLTGPPLRLHFRPLNSIREASMVIRWGKREEGMVGSPYCLAA
jgi:hypothetical protein